MLEEAYSDVKLDMKLPLQKKIVITKIGKENF